MIPQIDVSEVVPGMTILIESIEVPNMSCTIMYVEAVTGAFTADSYNVTLMGHDPETLNNVEVRITDQMKAVISMVSCEEV